MRNISGGKKIAIKIKSSEKKQDERRKDSRRQWKIFAISSWQIDEKVSYMYIKEN